MWYDVATTFNVRSGSVKCSCPLTRRESKRGLKSLLTSRAALSPAAEAGVEQGAKEVAEQTGEIIAKQSLNSALV
jgi:hypothetical protein